MPPKDALCPFLSTGQKVTQVYEVTEHLILVPCQKRACALYVGARRKCALAILAAPEKKK